MQEQIITGMIIKSEAFGEYDRRVVILTLETGKISAFAKGARRPTSKLLAATNTFSYGKFKIYQGKNSYSLYDAEITSYFEQLRTDLNAVCYGMYFAELVDYYTRENNDEKDFLKLIYVGLKALANDRISNKLVRYAFEIKAVCINGEYPGIPEGLHYLESTCYTIGFIAEIQIEKLYTFTVSKEVLTELENYSGYLQKRLVDRKFKSLEFIIEEEQ